MEGIRESFLQIKDTRHGSYVKHNLADVLILVMGCVVSGITELADMMVYIASKQDFYMEHFGVKEYPSKPTLSRILNMIDGDSVGRIIAQIMHDNAGNIGDIIAVDGKAIRSTGKKGKAHSYLQILTAYATESGISLGQSSISHEDKTNEIPVFQSMLDSLDIKGKTTKDIGYYISSLACHPESLLAASRSHWKIESMHWMLDVIWNEDTSGILSENGNKTINSFRKLALLAHKRFISTLVKKPSVKSNVLSAHLNDEILLQVIQSL